MVLLTQPEGVISSYFRRRLRRGGCGGLTGREGMVVVEGGLGG